LIPRLIPEQAAKTLHEKMAQAVLSSPMGFFETTASGAILNRFSSDMYAIDEILGPILSFFCETSLRTLIALAIIAAGKWCSRLIRNH
jgi:ATP-binding cassette, subfamily C (CFTR/MRP), member 1